MRVQFLHPYLDERIVLERVSSGYERVEFWDTYLRDENPFCRPSEIYSKLALPETSLKLRIIKYEMTSQC